MISSIRGICIDMTDDSVVIEVGGFGVEVFVTTQVLYKRAKPGEELRLFTHLKVAEDHLSLYGFTSKEELDLFRKLITVSGIGAKGGMNLLNYFRVPDLMAAIVREDAKELSKVYGIGAKTAKRIILDLKDKMDIKSLPPTMDVPHRDGLSLEGVESPAKQEAIEALQALGYSYVAAKKAIAKVEDADNADVETILKLSLKYLV